MKVNRQSFGHFSRRVAHHHFERIRQRGVDHADLPVTGEQFDGAGIWRHGDRGINERIAGQAAYHGLQSLRIHLRTQFPVHRGFALGIGFHRLLFQQRAAAGENAESHIDIRNRIAVGVIQVQTQRHGQHTSAQHHLSGTERYGLSGHAGDKGDHRSVGRDHHTVHSGPYFHSSGSCRSQPTLGQSIDVRSGIGLMHLHIQTFGKDLHHLAGHRIVLRILEQQRDLGGLHAVRRDRRYHRTGGGEGAGRTH